MSEQEDNLNMANDVQERLKAMMRELEEKAAAVRIATRMVEADKAIAWEDQGNREEAMRLLNSMLDKMGGGNGQA